MLSFKPVEEKIYGIDSLRFISALFVTMNHLGKPPIFTYLNENMFLVKVISGLYNIFFCGPAAVIVFFVISGFCIHYPYANGKKIFVPDFYIKRAIRILIPMLAFIIMGSILGIKFSDLNNTILWSLIAEISYYFLYPFLLRLNKNFTWTQIIITSYAISYLIILLNSKIGIHGGYPQYGYLNFLIGLPCWLIGVKIASEIKNDNSIPGLRKLNTLRFLIWFASIICTIMRFHLNIGYNFSLNIFAILVYYWIINEIRYYNNTQNNIKPLRYLELAGKWSFSLYLCHVTGNFVPNLGFSSFPIFKSVINIGVALFVSYCFYLIIEKPSHKLSKIFSIEKILKLWANIRQSKPTQ